MALFNKANIRATVLASIPWFLQDLGTYGLGIFMTTILAASIAQNTTLTTAISRHHQQRRLGGQGSGPHRSASDRWHLICAIAAGEQDRQHPVADLGVYRPRRGLAIAASSGYVTGGPKFLPDLRGLHGVQFHDQPWAELSNLPYCRRDVSDAGSRHGRRLRSGLRKGRRSRDCVSISNPACRYRSLRRCCTSLSGPRSLALSSPGFSGSIRPALVSNKSEADAGIMCQSPH